MLSTAQHTGPVSHPPPSTPGLVASALAPGQPPSSSSPGPISPDGGDVFGPHGRLARPPTGVTKAALKMHAISTAPTPHYALPGPGGIHGGEAISPGPMSAHSHSHAHGSSAASTVSETETAPSQPDAPKSPASSRQDSLQPATSAGSSTTSVDAFGLGLSGAPTEAAEEDEEEGTPPPLPTTEAAIMSELRGAAARGHRRELSRLSAAEQEVASILVTVGTPRLSTPRQRQDSLNHMDVSGGPMRDLSAAFEAHDRMNGAPGSSASHHAIRHSISPAPSSSPSYGTAHMDESGDTTLMAHPRMFGGPAHPYSAPDYLEHPQLSSSSPMHGQQSYNYAGARTSPYGSALGPPVASTSRAPATKKGRKRAVEEEEEEDLADDGALPDPYAKPPFSYAGLIGQAIMTRPDRRMALADIYAWIATSYPYYKVGDAGWQNSIRHNLSLNECFYKTARQPHEIGKGSLWAIKAGTEGQFAGGGFVKKSQLGKKIKPAKAAAAARALVVAQEQYRRSQSSPGGAPPPPMSSSGPPMPQPPLSAPPPPLLLPTPPVATSSATRTTRKRAAKAKLETSPVPPGLGAPQFSSSPMRAEMDDDDDEYDPNEGEAAPPISRKRSGGPASDELNAASTMMNLAPAAKRARTHETSPAPGTYMSGTSSAASAAAFAAAAAHAHVNGSGADVAPTLVSSPAHANGFTRPVMPASASALGAPFMPPPSHPFSRRDSLPPITAAAPPSFDSHLLRSPVSSAREEPGPMASPTRPRTSSAFGVRGRSCSTGSDLGDDGNRTPILRSNGRQMSANGSSGLFASSRSLQGASAVPGTPAHLATPRYEHSSPQRGANPYDPNDQAMFEVQRRLAPSTPKMTTPQFGSTQFGSPW